MKCLNALITTTVLVLASSAVHAHPFYLEDPCNSDNVVQSFLVTDNDGVLAKDLVVGKPITLAREGQLTSGMHRVDRLRLFGSGYGKENKSANNDVVALGTCFEHPITKKYVYVVSALVNISGRTRLTFLYPHYEPLSDADGSSNQGGEPEEVAPVPIAILVPPGVDQDLVMLQFDLDGFLEAALRIFSILNYGEGHSHGQP